MRDWIEHAWRAPTRRLILALGLGLAVALAFLVIAIGQTRHGLAFSTVGEAVTVTTGAGGRARQAPMAVAALADGQGRVFVPEPLDLTEDPTMLPDYQVAARFMARQDEAATLLKGPLRLTLQDGAKTRVIALPAPRLAPPPALFWYQLFVGAAIYGLAAWLWASGSGGWVHRLFLLAGFAMLLAAGSAGIYSTRELALPSGLFRTLGALNELGASLFGLAIMTVTMIYPRALLPRAVVLGLWALFVPWIALAVAHAVPGPEWGSNVISLLEMVGIALFVAWQFVVTRGDPVARAAVRWFGLGTVIGPGCFILTEIVPPIMGRAPLLDQGLAFGFFLVIVAGVFIGLRRDRLFAVDALSYAILYYALIAVALVAAEATVLYGLDSHGRFSLPIALAVLALFYLPLRDRLVERIGGARRPDLLGLLESLNRIGFLREPEDREAVWAQSLDLAFQPLGQEPIPSGDAHIAVTDEGAAMVVPAVAGMKARRLRLARRGHGLFGEADRLLAERLLAIAARADMERAAFERGVVEERNRMARDLHDDLAAHLMGGLAHTQVTVLHETIRRALAEVRAIVSGRHNLPADLSDVLADLRVEAADRLEIAGIALDWPPVDLPGRLEGARVRALEASLREAVTNVVRHSGAARVAVEVESGVSELRLSLADDGRGPVGEAEGNGLRNMAYRIGSVGGEVSFPAVPQGFCVRMSLPLEEVE